MTPKPPVVLLTDFGLQDAYVASMKGVILSLYPEAKIVDLSHGVEPQNVAQAAFLLEAAYRYFPKGSVFVCVVDPGVGSRRRILAARTRQGTFLAPDNGLLTRVLGREKPHELRHVTHAGFFLRTISRTFHGRDCFAPTGARLAKNPGSFSKLGPRCRSFTRLHLSEPRCVRGRICGEIVYFDHFGNAFTNISDAFLKTPHDGRIVVKHKNLGPLRGSYFESAKGSALAVVSSTGWVEIAVNQGSAREKLHLKVGDPVEVRLA